MNARKTIAVFAVLALTSIGSAAAAVNNVNSRGQFVPMGSNQVAARRSFTRPSYSRRVYSAPAVIAAPAPMVAAAPTEGRRFSYAPSTGQQVGGPCAAVTSAPSTAATTDTTRRFSYEPAPQTSVEAAPRTPVYSTPSYARRPATSSRRSSVELWQLPKTDPRKYGGR
jgi:hypothetical protein